MLKKISLGLLILTNSSLALGVNYSEDIYTKLAAKSGCLYKQGKGSNIKVYEKDMMNFAKRLGTAA